MKTGLIEAIKANKKAIIKRTLIAGGAITGLAVGMKLYSNRDNAIELYDFQKSDEEANVTE